MSFDSLLLKTMDIKAPSRAATGRGSFTTTYTTSVAAVPCRIRPLNASEREMSMERGAYATIRVYCRKISVQESDEILFDGNRTFEISYINWDVHGGHHIEIDVVERRKQQVT